MDKIDLMNKEFDAAKRLAEHYRRVTLTAVVDDDFPEVKHGYDAAALDFVAALQENRGAQLNFMRLGRVNLARALRWHPQGLGSWSLSDWSVALAGEVGELCNVVKKLNRVRDGLQQKTVDAATLRQNLADEIGDVGAYLDLLAQAAGLSLEECIVEKFNKISKREGFPERL